LNLRLQENLKLGACLGLERNEALLEPVHFLVEDVAPDGQFIHFVFDDIDAIGRRGSPDDDGSIVRSGPQETRDFSRFAELEWPNSVERCR
jgi:hypothetical protein